MEAQKAEERGPERRSQCLVERIPDPLAPLRAKRSQFVRLPQQLTLKGVCVCVCSVAAVASGSSGPHGL